MEEWIAESTAEGSSQDLCPGACTEVSGDFAQADGGVGSDAGLFIVGCFGKVSEELPVDDPIS